VPVAPLDTPFLQTKFQSFHVDPHPWESPKTTHGTSPTLPWTYLFTEVSSRPAMWHLTYTTLDLLHPRWRQHRDTKWHCTPETLHLCSTCRCTARTLSRCDTSSNWAHPFAGSVTTHSLGWLGLSVNPYQPEYSLQTLSFNINPSKCYQMSL
jgi:hypothetical protein